MKIKYQFQKDFSEALFKNPPSEYRGTPFWAWNGELDRTVIKEQIDTFKTMGFGGFHIHSRIGLATEYLGEEFMDCVRFCNQYAADQGMLTYLYDEDKWPSGYGGGQVTKNKAFGARYLLFSPYHHESGHYCRKLRQRNRLSDDGEITLLSQYRVVLADGKLLGYERITDVTTVDQTAGNIWYAYLLVTDKSPWFNNETYVDTLNPQAIEAFVESTYEPYYQAVGREFSQSIPSIFTDEPQFTKVQNFKDGAVLEEVGIPFTDGFEEEFRRKYHFSLLDHLPEVFWMGAEGRAFKTRYCYYEVLSGRFADAYAGTLGQWCDRHEIMLTGHLMEESTLEGQLRSVGEAMRSYQYFQMAGIDILANSYEFNTAKQAQSVARQMGKPGLISELYGVTNWNFDFRGHKLQGDWQAALGVTIRVPHLAWMYMGGESKRDYPAPIDAHSPWFARYKIIENYFSRLGTVLTRGKAIVNICVVHPIESMFMFLGPDTDTVTVRKRLEENFENLTKWLMDGLTDFDFVSEELLTKLETEIKNGRFRVGQMEYQVIILPELINIRSSTLKILELFQRSGGTVIVMGNAPKYVDAEFQEDTVQLPDGCLKIGFDKNKLEEVLKGFRELDIIDSNGLRPAGLIYQLRQDHDRKWLFIAHGEQEAAKGFTYAVKDQTDINKIKITLPGNYHVTGYDAMNGEIRTADFVADMEKTVISCEFNRHDSLLLGLMSGTERADGNPAGTERQLLDQKYLPSEVGYSLAEPNLVLLDMAEYRLDEADWSDREEILRIDNLARAAFDYRLRTDNFPQPWLTRTGNNKEHLVELKFEIESEIMADVVELAFEGDADYQFVWNGAGVTTDLSRNFLDRSIYRLKLGSLKIGVNVLLCRIPFGILTNLEWFYLLGDFGVRICGSKSYICKKPVQIGFGDYVTQGFPFYGGNFCYEMEIETVAGWAELEIGEYLAPLIDISIDHHPPVSLFAAPYRAKLGNLTKGKHLLTITSYGSRINMFGQIHNCNQEEKYFGPRTWRTDNENWCYEYRLHRCGIMKAPILRVYEV